MVSDVRNSVHRRSPKTGLDDFPTPPWAVRAFFRYVAPDLTHRDVTFHDPACGRGHMVRTVQEFAACTGSDIKDYGHGYPVLDYTNGAYPTCDVIITNPPYKVGTEFVEKSLLGRHVGVGMLVKTLWLEGGKHPIKSRWVRLFRDRPPHRVFIFSARMPAAKGRVVRKRAVIMSHSWLYWDLTPGAKRQPINWIPPEAQDELEKIGDYKRSFLLG